MAQGIKCSIAPQWAVNMLSIHLSALSTPGRVDPDSVSLHLMCFGHGVALSSAAGVADCDEQQSRLRLPLVCWNINSPHRVIRVILTRLEAEGRLTLP